MKDLILSQYDEENTILFAYGEKCKGIILELLEDKFIDIHHITTRVKDKDSLERKISKKGKNYRELSDITDVCGIRVITYLESDVDKIAKIIEEEFDVDIEHSIDKRKLNNDQFSYRSLHYVISLNGQRLSSSENKKYIGYKLEIQIRSILQHAWAEIEHDLGYKNEIGIPDDFKRRFNRLAALLETADVEFDRLKADLATYESSVTVAIEKDPDMVELNQATLLSFSSHSLIFHKALKVIKDNTKAKFYEVSEVSGELEKLKFLGITTIGELSKILLENSVQYLCFVDLLTKDMIERRLITTMPLFYFLHFIACGKLSASYLKDYFQYGKMKLGGGRKTEEDFIRIYKVSIS